MLLVTFFVLFSTSAAQDCVLKLGAWESYPEEVHEDGSSSRRRKGTIERFSATALNKTTGKTYSGTYLLGNVYFEDIPKGLYSITVRKPGFKTTVQTHRFSCDSAYDGFDFSDILVFRGNAKEIVKREQPNTIPPRDPTRYTVKGDRDFSNTVNSIPPRTRPVPRQISGGVLNGKALALPKPPYPPAARAVRASGAVSVAVIIDENGDVISASAVSGHPLLQTPAVQAAFAAKFAPTSIEGQPVKVSGVITYNFVP